MTSLAPVLFDYAEKEGKSIYIVASKQEEVDKAVKIFTTRWPKLRILGYRNGYFSSEREVEDEIRTITETGFCDCRNGGINAGNISVKSEMCRGGVYRFYVWWFYPSDCT